MFDKLSWDIIREILLYDPRFVLQKNKLVFIGRISREDERYLLLSNIPRIYHMSSNSWQVILSEPISKKRFVLGYRCNTQWEFFFHIFSYNHPMREINKQPDIMICFQKN
jgi:hypothetical protein